MRIVPVNLPGVVELVTPFEPREILCAFHDIDGTHSLIREWVPPMALILGWVVEHGLPPSDRAEAFERIFSARDRISEEARRFSIESAGLSGLTQMEWALRSALEAGTISGISFDRRINREILDGIEHGRELFDGYEEPAAGNFTLSFTSKERGPAGRMDSATEPEANCGGSFAVSSTPSGRALPLRFRHERLSAGDQSAVNC